METRDEGERPREEQAQLPARAADALLAKPREILGRAVRGLKGPDLPRLVEEFTDEMTLVAEGMAREQERLAREQEQGSARTTVLEEGLRRQERELRQRFQALEDRLEVLEARYSKGSKSGVTAALRQATWLAGLAGAAWVLVSLIRALGG